MSDGRWVLLIASELGGTNSVSDRAMERLCNAIAEEGYEVVRTSTPEDGLSLVKSDPSHSAILLDWDLEEEHQFDERAALKIIRNVRRRNKKVPIFLIADRTLVSELPLEVVKQVHEYIHLFGDTPAFIANRVDFAVARYNEQLLPPYFRELKNTPIRAPTRGTPRAIWAAWPSSSIRWACSFTVSSARTCCAPTWASPLHRSAPGLTISDLRQNRSAMPRASSERIGPFTF
jgi:hypothetical protein